MSVSVCARVCVSLNEWLHKYPRNAVEVGGVFGPFGKHFLGGVGTPGDEICSYR